MQTQDMQKDQVFRLRLEERDRARLDRLAAHHEMTASQIVRMLLKQADDAIAPVAPAAPASKPKARAKKP